MSCIGCDMNLPLVNALGKPMHKFERFKYWECTKDYEAKPENQDKP